MNSPLEKFNRTNKPQAIALSAKPSLIQEIAAFWMAILQRFVRPVEPSAVRTLKMQLLVVYSVPALFFFGSSGLILVALYVCIFELVLLAGRSLVRQATYRVIASKYQMARDCSSGTGSEFDLFQE